MRCTFLFASLLATTLVSAEVKVVEEIVCKVNGDIITRTELERDRLRVAEDLRRQGLSGARLNDALNARSKDLLRERIDNLLLISKGKEMSINVDSEMNKRLADIQRSGPTDGPDHELLDQLVTEASRQPELARA